LTFKHDLDKIKMNQFANYLGQRSFKLKVVLQTHTGRGRSAERLNAECVERL